MISRHNKLPFLFLIFGLFLAYYSSLAVGSEASREKAFSSAIHKTLSIGKAISLEADGTTFLGILNENMDIEPKGTVILLHGLGSHPNSQQVIQPLRAGLTKHGWVTLSIQLPILDTGAKNTDYLALLDKAKPRIEAALKYINDNHPKPSVIIGHSLGALMASHFLAGQTNSACSAFVTISSPNFKTTDQSTELNKLLEKINLPILDIYGSQDLSSITQQAGRRKQTFIKNSPHNRQAEIIGADHNYTGLDNALLSAIRGWLSKTLGEPAI